LIVSDKGGKSKSFGMRGAMGLLFPDIRCLLLCCLVSKYSKIITKKQVIIQSYGPGMLNVCNMMANEIHIWKFLIDSLLRSF
jgi:hypothetical protein